MSNSTDGNINGTEDEQSHNSHLSTTDNSTLRNRRRPNDYARAISKHSTRSEHESLYPGVHHRPIARFLNAPSYHRLGSLTPAHPAIVKREHKFAVLHDLAYDRQDPRYLTQFDGPEQFLVHQAPHENCGQLLFLRGFPSQEWINTIGARYRVDPEIFRRQLQHGPKCEYFDLPDLPSSSMNIIRLFTSTIGLRQVLSVNRQEEMEALESHFHSLGSRSGLVGESIVRQVWSHDEIHFSIEQNIYITVIRREDGWIALILLDHGRDLDEGPEGPWLNSSSQRGKFDSIFQPVIQFDPRVWSTDKPTKDNDSTPNGDTAASHRPYAQSASLLASRQYGQFLNPALMRIDPFYALHDIFAFCCNAENQFLNALRYKVRPSQSRVQDEKALQNSLEDLRYHKNLLRTKVEQLEDVIECVQSRGNPKWLSWRPIAPLPTTSFSSTGSSSIRFSPRNRGSDTNGSVRDSMHTSHLRGEADSAANKTLQDYKGLMRRAAALSKLYNEEIDDIRTSAALLEAKKSVDLAESIGRLSWLAFLFLPLSFTAALFGMNFREIGSDLSIWIYVALSVPIFLITLVIYSWPKIRAKVESWISGHKMRRRQQHGIERLKAEQANKASMTIDMDDSAQV